MQLEIGIFTTLHIDADKSGSFFRNQPQDDKNTYYELFNLQPCNATLSGSVSLD